MKYVVGFSKFSAEAYACFREDVPVTDETVPLVSRNANPATSLRRFGSGTGRQCSQRRLRRLLSFKLGCVYIRACHEAWHTR